MKYLLILLFLFSTQSFSGEIDGKGLDCDMVRLTDSNWLNYDVPHGYPNPSKALSNWRAIFWFNNDLVQPVVSTKVPNNKKITPDEDWTRYYYTDDSNIWWYPYSYEEEGIYQISRKLLTLVKQELINGKLELAVTGQCEVFTSFKVVKKRQKEFKRDYEEYKRKKEEEKRKAREGNKL